MHALLRLGTGQGGPVGVHVRGSALLVLAPIQGEGDLLAGRRSRV